MFQVAYKTDVGKKRTNNQDAVKLCDDLKCYIVADGMGGHLAGEIASQTAVETIEAYIRSHIKSGDFEECIRQAIVEANKHVYLKSLDNNEYRGMGTTCSMVLIQGDKIHLGHVGDSRIYFVNEKGMDQITTDHSLVENLVANGEITKEEAKTHPKRHVITRAIGTDPTVKVDYSNYDIGSIKQIVICSDGLTEKVDDQEILNTINTHTINDAVNFLVELANERGGTDNISVILVSLTKEC